MSQEQKSLSQKKKYQIAKKCFKSFKHKLFIFKIAAWQVTQKKKHVYKITIYYTDKKEYCIHK